MKAHDKMRYECDQCDKKFISNSALKCHMMNVHIRSRPYNCRYDIIYQPTFPVPYASH